jgi:hypothetical protein
MFVIISDMLKGHRDMKMKALFLLILLGMSVAAPGHAAPLTSMTAMHDWSELQLVANKKSKKKYNNYNKYKYAKDEPYIPGHVRTPYGYRDCIGWWERLSDGRMLCHGQLIRDY